MIEKINLSLTCKTGFTSSTDPAAQASTLSQILIARRIYGSTGVAVAQRAAVRIRLRQVVGVRPAPIARTTGGVPLARTLAGDRVAERTVRVGPSRIAFARRTPDRVAEVEVVEVAATRVAVEPDDVALARALSVGAVARRAGDRAVRIAAAPEAESVVVEELRGAAEAPQADNVRLALTLSSVGIAVRIVRLDRIAAAGDAAVGI